MASDRWSHTAGQKLRAQYLRHCKDNDLPCWLCGQPIDYNGRANSRDSFEPDHFYPRSNHPELALDWDNLRPSHCSCNRSRGNRDAALPLGRRSAAW
ncbi:hypothetical protein CPHO_07160 [Corynebacterium phocae]|uniref:HNH nuclease domain-containing protein n=1 Tax=Corynebacterium phocae TaxID=161895 RepID=A0A1L7D3J8_9CORY|nr:HNH endonuclease [Corynebacterium phocae]APT92704.1 hypothetical protein CPHO_07160 [Corynebacterium phocae]KAA8723009.1 HNH endonuclease [Corynebacterium phocae]